MIRGLMWGLRAFLALGLVSAPSFQIVNGQDGAIAQDRNCKNTADFAKWLRDFSQEAKSSGLSPQIVDQAFDGVQFDPAIIKQDRRQHVFSQTFLQFSSRMVNQFRLDRGKELLRQNNALFTKIERDYGVPGAVIAAFWALETDFGGFLGNESTISALASLAYDCRRPDKFRTQLMSALYILDAGHLTLNEMRGAWAGELGQTQFLPKDYLRNGVDYDGDGQINLIKSRADVLASTANLLKYHGWKTGQPWLEEVQVPQKMDWSQASIQIQHPRSRWRQWGVTKIGGGALENDGLQASLLLPMGRNGPAFLAYDNFHVYFKWNQSYIYSTTAAYLATRYTGKPKVSQGRAKITPFTYEQIKNLQRLLVRAGYNVGGVDGKMGLKTRQAVRKAQQKFGLPADAYPTPGLLRQLGG